jgi:hypothetical protein
MHTFLGFVAHSLLSNTIFPYQNVMRACLKGSYNFSSILSQKKINSLILKCRIATITLRNG